VVEPPDWNHGEHPGLAAKRETAQDIICPIPVLGRLSVDQDWKTRTGVASNVACPPHILERLSQDFDLEVRWSVAANPSSPPAALEYLSSDLVGNIREDVAHNPACPPSVLERLLRQDTNHLVIQAAADNPGLPRAALTQWVKTHRDQQPT
jgi:hypothetical protein